MTQSPIQYPTIVHMLRDAANRAPTREAIGVDDRALSYAQYLHCVAALAHTLVDLGARRERVAIVAHNGFDICVATYATLAAGAQAVPLNPLYTRRELEQILADAAPIAIAHSKALSEVIVPIANALDIAHRLELDEDAWFAQEWFAQDDSAVRTLPLPQPLPEPSDLAMLQYTGGTTGRAKGVNLSHDATARNIAQREAILPTGTDGERIVCVMPLFHAYALSMALYLAPYCRGTLLIRRKYHPEDLLRTIERERITIFPASPTLLKSLITHERFHETDFSTLKFCYSGSAPLAEDTLRQWEATTGAPVYEGYGQTEAGPVLSFNPAGGARKVGSVGVPVGDTEIDIVDTATGRRVLGVGEVGEIRARGPQLMRDYRNLPNETAKALRDGWLYTGDVGEFDTDGYLYIRDRLKDMAIVSGYNVYPREIEEVLFAHPAVVDAAAVGVEDAYRGEVIKAYVVLNCGDASLIESVLTHCRENLAPYKVPTTIDALPSLPKTSVGKTDKVALRANG